MILRTRLWSIVVLAVLFGSQPVWGGVLFPVIRDSEQKNKTAAGPTAKQPDRFSNNSLEVLFKDNRVTAKIDSGVLDGNILSLTGVVTYQQVSTHPNITNEVDMVGKSGSSALILQAELDGENLVLKWMKRSCPCSKDAKFVITSTNEGDDVWVAGSTTGIDKGEEGMTDPGMALMRYNSQGKQLLLRQLGGAGEHYDWVGYTSSTNNGTRNVTLVGTVNSERFEGLQKALVAEVANASGDIVKTALISDGENVVSETFWSAESMGRSLYVVGKRSLQIGLTPTSKLTLTKMNTDKMTVAGVRDFENELQRAISLCTDGQGVTASYVARNNNQGHVVVEEMDDTLVNVNRTKVKIERDLEYQKAVKGAEPDGTRLGGEAKAEQPTTGTVKSGRQQVLVDLTISTQHGMACIWDGRQERQLELANLRHNRERKATAIQRDANQAQASRSTALAVAKHNDNRRRMHRRRNDDLRAVRGANHRRTRRHAPSAPPTSTALTGRHAVSPHRRRRAVRDGAARGAGWRGDAVHARLVRAHARLPHPSAARAELQGAVRCDAAAC
ncbi:hypothetical protein FGB62_139g236 [Gracilaria domingensis]|nr:hypothetical protein FGB62_139g236 [Gracilaria domingensis]